MNKPLTIGTVVEGYQIDGVLGEGGMGVVYEATDLFLANRRVALKLVSAGLSDDDAFRGRFKREAEVQADLEHPHIVPVYRAGESDWGLFIAMRLVRGPNLKDLITGGDLATARTARLLTQVASALDAAHAVGLIHRDIKPYNILIDASRDHAYLADFGIAKARGRNALTKLGELPGTPDYISPEQIEGKPATERSDVYSFGAVLYECLAGSAPYPKDSDVAVMYAHIWDPVPVVSEQRPDLPPAVDAVVQRALAKTPEERYGSASELMEDFRLALGDQYAGTLGPSPDEVPTTRTDRTTDAALLAEAEEMARLAEERREAEQAEPARSQETVQASIGATPAPPVDPTVISQQPAPPPPAEPTVLSPGGAPPAADEPPPGPRAEPTVLAPGGGATVPAGERPAPAPPTTPSLTPPAAPTQVGAAGAATIPAGAAVEAPVPDLAPPAERKAPPTRRGAEPKLQLLIVAVLAVVAVVVGVFLGRVGLESEPLAAEAGPPVQLRAGALRLEAPPGWQRTAAPAQVPGLELSDAVSAAPADGPQGAALLAGRVDGAWPTYLPKAFAERLPAEAAAARELVQLGEQQLSAFRYRNVRLEGSPVPVTLYVVPQANSTTALACAVPAVATEVAAACERGVASLSIEGAGRYPLAPGRSYAAQLNRLLQRLATARTRGVRTLAAASTQAAQGEAAADVAAAYAAAAKAAREAEPTAHIRPAHTPIVQSLTQTRAAYTRLADAARTGDRAAYDAARKAVDQQETRLRRRVAALASLGFRVGG